MKSVVLLFGIVIASAVASQAQLKMSTPPTTDVMGVHDMGSWGPSPIQGALTTCQYCHAPHSSMGQNITGGVHVPLWSQKLSSAQYQLYTGSTNPVAQPTQGSASNLCLSCHDGTVAPGTAGYWNYPYGKVAMRGSMAASDIITNYNNGSSTTALDLQGVHPFNFNLTGSNGTFAQDGGNGGLGDLVPNLLQSPPSTNDSTGAVKLIGGNVQCTSCHEPHVQGIDSSNTFLVIDNSDSALCLACHISNPGQNNGMALRQKPVATGTGTGATTNAGATAGTYNAFTGWTASAHALSTSRVAVAAKLGNKGTMRKNGCASCHTTHNAPGGANLLTGPLQPVPNMDSTTQNCITCHNGGSNLSPVIPNVFAEFAKTGHPFPTSNARHNSQESQVLNNNRHATCVDCHDAHASKPTASFVTTTIRASQTGVNGISSLDGTTILKPAQNQFETCLRCHSTSTGKQSLAIFGYLPTRSSPNGDPLNILPQFSVSSASSHPVMHDSNSGLSQPSLLKAMLNLDGHTQGRTMGTRIMCTDCHNSDDNREFGGTGPNGPHGSNYSHILERRYEFSKVAPGVAPTGGPGTTIQNPLPAITDPSAGGPYSLCAKCHDLNNVLSDASFNRHSLHIKAGFSCSVCHTAHGTSAVSTGSSGLRLVSFDLAVVAPNDQTQTPITYNRSGNSCTLKCHNYNHNSDGTVSLSAARTIGGGKR